MLEVSGLTKKYGKTLAADQIGFTVPDGKIGILLGPNGAGKSTVIKSIAGLVRYKGSIRIQGRDAGSLEDKRCFAYVPELPYMYDALLFWPGNGLLLISILAQKDAGFPTEELHFMTKSYTLPTRRERFSSRSVFGALPAAPPT